jgi:hypothetical protein
MSRKILASLSSRLCCALLGGCIALPGLAVGAAAQPAGTNAMRQACMPDYNAYCSGTSPGGGRIIACLRQHAQSLSPDCLKALQSVQAAQKAQGGS